MYFYGPPVTYKECHKDLRILLTSNLSSSNHYIWMYLIQCSLTARTFTKDFRNASTDNTKLQLYISFVQLQLTYCSQLWQPHLIEDILLIERVQRWATKYVLDDFNFDHKTLFLKLCYTSSNDAVWNLRRFFVRSYHNPTNSFDITNYAEFLSSNTGARIAFKLKHLHSSNSSKYHPYFSRSTFSYCWHQENTQQHFKAHFVSNFHCILDAPVTNVSNRFSEARRSYWFSLRTVVAVIAPCR